MLMIRTGKWVKAIIKNREKLLGKRVLAATDYYTPEQIVAEFAEVTGNKATYVQITPEQYTSAMPPAAATEYLQNHQFMESPGYFAGASLDEGHAILDKEDKPITWKEYVLSLAISSYSSKGLHAAVDQICPRIMPTLSASNFPVRTKVANSETPTDLSSKLHLFQKTGNREVIYEDGSYALFHGLSIV